MGLLFMAWMVVVTDARLEPAALSGLLFRACDDQLMAAGRSGPKEAAWMSALAHSSETR